MEKIKKENPNAKWMKKFIQKYNPDIWEGLWEVVKEKFQIYEEEDEEDKEN